MGRKATVSLAMLALFCGGALAQQNATVYGIIDVGVQWNKQYASSTNQQESLLSIDSGYQSGSRFGLRARAARRTFAAIYQLEGGFDVSTGQSTQGARCSAGRRGRTAGRLASWSPAARNAVFGHGSFDMWAAVDRSPPASASTRAARPSSPPMRCARTTRCSTSRRCSAASRARRLLVQPRRIGDRAAGQQQQHWNLAASYSAGAVYAV